MDVTGTLASISPRTPHCRRFIGDTKLWHSCCFKFISFWIKRRRSGATEAMTSSSSSPASWFSSRRLWRSGRPSGSPYRKNRFRGWTKCERNGQNDDDDRLIFKKHLVNLTHPLQIRPRPLGHLSQPLLSAAHRPAQRLDSRPHFTVADHQEAPERL